MAPIRLPAAVPSADERWAKPDVDALAGVATVAGPATLLDLLAHVHPARCFVGNDSGPGHLAGALGVPTVSIFGPVNPKRWKPLGPTVTVLTGPTLDAVTVDQVAEAAIAAKRAVG